MQVQRILKRLGVQRISMTGGIDSTIRSLGGIERGVGARTLARAIFHQSCIRRSGRSSPSSGGPSALARAASIVRGLCGKAADGWSPPAVELCWQAAGTGLAGCTEGSAGEGKSLTKSVAVAGSVAHGDGLAPPWTMKLQPVGIRLTSISVDSSLQFADTQSDESCHQQRNSWGSGGRGGLCKMQTEARCALRATCAGLSLRAAREWADKRGPGEHSSHGSGTVQNNDDGDGVNDETISTVTRTHSKPQQGGDLAGRRPTG